MLSAEIQKQRKVSGSRIGKIMDGQADEVFDDMMLGLNDPVNNQMQRGIDMEGMILQKYQDKTDNEVLRQGGTVYAHPKFAHHTTMPDAIIKSNGSQWVGEVKAHNSHMLRKINREGLPLSIICQGHWHCHVAGFEQWEYITLDWDKYEIVNLMFDADKDLISDMKAAADDFWFNNIMKNVRPEPMAGPIIDMPITSTGEVVKLDNPEWLEAVADLREARDLKKDATMINAEAQLKLQKLMGAAGADVAEGGGARIYFKEQSGRKKFDVKAFAKANPDVDLNLFYTYSKAFRSFRPYFTEG